MNPSYLQMSNVDAVEEGTNGGGSIEVYATMQDAQERDAYFSKFDGSVFACGSHKVIGTIVVRTSRSLTASEQRAFEAEIIEALITLTPGKVIER